MRAALRAGVGFPHECNVGGCGACRFELIDGEIEETWANAPGLSERDRRRGKKLACQTRVVGDCRIRVRCEDSYVPALPPTKLEFVLIQREMLTHDMARLCFEARQPVQFLPGQYALIYLPGVTGSRAYSMSNVADGSGLLEFIVRRTPAGAGSGCLVAHLPVGATVEIDGPYGHAYLRESVQRPIVCIAGGSGLAPMLSVARRAAMAMEPQIDFFFGGRSVDDLCAEPMLSALPGYHQRIRLHNVVSGVTEANWQGATGWVHEEVERVIGESAKDREFYFAGPPPMIEALQEWLMLRRQVPFDQIHFDRFV